MFWAYVWGMCRTSGARHRYTPGTQRSRAGLTSDAPTALQEKRRCRPKPTLQRRRKEPTSPIGTGAWHPYTPRTQRSRAGLTSDAPTYPTLTGWANFWRAYGATGKAKMSA